MTVDKAQHEANFKRLAAGLPHLYGRKWYAWAKTYYESRNFVNLLCAANQISKSSTQIRKCIEWAGNPKLWPELWKEEHNPPRQFWYLYPDRATATNEVNLKWIPEFLPRGEYKNHKTYGWEVFYGDKRSVERIVFNSGVVVFFKTYEQDVKNLQSGTVHAIFCDEELPVEFLDELMLRTAAVDGYFHMVFTATRNQDYWKLAIEGDGEVEKLPEAHKQQISMYDCMTYIDGSLGAYTEEKIDRIKARCRSEAEVQRRVYGRFVTEIGRKYPQFDATRHYKKPFVIGPDWKRYVAVDYGTGGEQGHPPAIVFVAVRPDYRFAAVYRGWRGDDGPDYTASDIFNKFVELRANDILTLQKFDQQAKDFGTIAERAGETFLPSDKSHERGEDVVNTLFKNDMLVIFDTPELRKLGDELTGLMRTTPKNKAKDDLCDGLRYCVTDIPWDWAMLKGLLTEEETREVDSRPLTDQERVEMELRERRGEMVDELRPGEKDEGWRELDAEFAEWNDRYG
jgi:phage terminase large subunit-like protein